MEKRLLFIACAISGILTISAQESENKSTIDKGTWLAGGNVSFIARNSEFESPDSQGWGSTLGFTVSPILGYAPKQNLIVGLGLIYSNYNFESSSEDDEVTSNYESKNESFGLRPFIRAYKGFGEHLSLFIQGEASYTKSWSHAFQDTEQERKYSSDDFFVGLRPGLAFFISQKLALETSIGSLGYRRSTREDNVRTSFSNSIDSFEFSLNASDVFFGLSFYF